MVDRIPGCIQLAEARLNRLLRTQDQVTVSDITVNSAYTTLPSDWAQTSNLAFTNNPVEELEYLTPDAFARARRTESANGKPKYYTITGRQHRFLPAPDSAQAITHIYWAVIPALSATNASNWLLERHPDIYLSATLYYLCRILKDQEGMNEADADLVRSISELGISDDRSKVPTTPKVRVKPI